VRRVLVTGARGFLGRRCLPLLAARGFEVHAVSSAGAGAAPFTWHRCDLLEGAQADALLARVRPSHLLHLAWITRPGEFWESPENARWLEAGARLFGRFYAAGGERAVGIGSCAEYAASEAPCDEEATPVAPATAYGHAKAALQRSLAAACGGGSWAWARVFFPYGPGEQAGRFIPDLIDSLLAGRAFDCTHGLQVRDYVYADDVAEACAALVASGTCGIYNVASGTGTRLREVAAAVAARIGGAELVRYGAREAGAHEPARVVASIAKIRDHLAWSPRVGLEEGLRRAIAARKEGR
jgi:nucleoside-diphosphate-sugar epimerase